MEVPHLSDPNVESVPSGAPMTGSPLQAGNRVQVAHGVFAGVEGVVRERRDPGRVIVSLNLLQAGVSLEIDECLLMLLS